MTIILNFIKMWPAACRRADTPAHRTGRIRVSHTVRLGGALQAPPDSGLCNPPFACQPSGRFGIDIRSVRFFGGAISGTRSGPCLSMGTKRRLRKSTLFSSDASEGRKTSMANKAQHTRETRRLRRLEALMDVVCAVVLRRIFMLIPRPDKSEWVWNSIGSFLISGR